MIATAGIVVLLANGEVVMLFQCGAGYYGALGESCKPCPVGGQCDGACDDGMQTIMFLIPCGCAVAFASPLIPQRGDVSAHML